MWNWIWLRLNDMVNLDGDPTLCGDTPNRPSGVLEVLLSQLPARLERRVMSDTKVELSAASIAPSTDASLKLTSDASLSDSGNQMNLKVKAERIGQVTLEGLALTPAGALHAIQNDLKPENWGKDLELIASSAAAGVVLRTLLPKNGAVATAAGLVMGALFVKDAATPIAHAWGTVSSDSSKLAMKTAAEGMAEGLGEFAVNGGISLVVTVGAVKMTPGLWNKAAPKTWNSIETFKADHLGATSPLGMWLGGIGGQVGSRINSLADRLDPPSASLKNLPPAERAQLLENARSEQALSMKNERLYRQGLTGSDGHSHGLDRTVDLLLAGKDPRTVPANNADGRLSTLSEMELAKPQRIAGDRSVPPAQEPAPALTEAERIFNERTMSAQADVVKAAHEAIPAEHGLVLDGINRATGTVHVRTNAELKPLSGYGESLDAMLVIAAELRKDPASFAQWQSAFSQYTEAAIQSGAGTASEVGMHVARFNEYAKTNFETYRRNIIRAGIDENVALQRKSVAPLGEASSDVELVGRTNNGKPIYQHQGPYTQPAVYGPNGEPIFPVDLIKIPLRDVAVRAIQTSGDYGHEFMHDQFGRMGAFDPSVRDARLGEAAARALGPDAGKKVKLPNGGVDPQQVMLKNVERHVEKLEPAEKDAFLSKALQLDPELRTAKSLKAADTLLGENGKSQIEIGGTMPLGELIAKVAVEADTRSPAAVLAEARGNGDPAQTAKLVRTNIDKILGADGGKVIRLGDGSTQPLSEVVAKVSDMTRNPHFDTYGEALPKTMTNQDVLVNIAKGWADETFADWGAAAESGQFSVLGDSAKLSSRTIMGQELRSAENQLGIEVHQVEKLRPRYQAALVRALATAKGGHDQVLLDWAAALERYSRDAGKPGDIVIASMDAPGKSITIPEPVMDKFIVELVQTQLNTPLPRLQGHTLIEILPDLGKNFRINDNLSNQWVAAIKKDALPESISFDTANATITNVYGAGQLAFLKLVADRVDPLKANEAVNRFSDFFGNKYLKNNPHASTSFLTRLELAPKQTLAQIPDLMNKKLADTLRTYPAVADRFGQNAIGIAGGSAAYQVQDLIQRQKD